MKINLATKITIARILLIFPTIVAYIVAHIYAYDSTEYLAIVIAAATLFAICCSTDFVDGYIARKTGTVSDLGKLLDPLADKVVIVIMLFLIVLYRDGLTMNGTFEANTIVIALLSGLILSRELLISVFRSIAASKNLLISADVFGKIKTVFLDVSVTTLMLAGLHVVIGWMGTVLFYMGAVLTLFSGVRYIIKNKHVLQQDKVLPQAKADESEAVHDNGDMPENGSSLEA
ncbi:MAG: CDP-diacylglycerol--glycerol-3-phosphate 3-phosphatidyltransferase [Clostridia bacterium]|nr:CDP-diacylglycerol--glycerol-3-phosphate 3-phosphatidyltransferase [Clostridia bacterium]